MAGTRVVVALARFAEKSSGGFDYSGSSESVSLGAETGPGPWQSGLLASFTCTDLDYRTVAFRDLCSGSSIGRWHATACGSPRT